MGGSKFPAPESGASGYPQLNFAPKGQQIHNIYQDRIRQFAASGQYESKNLRSMFISDKEDSSEYVKLEVYSVPNLARIPFGKAIEGDFKPTAKWSSFGPSWSTHWFKVNIAVPIRMLKQERLEFHWDSDCEGLIWTADGEPVQGLTGGGERVEYQIPESWRDGKQHLFYVEVACNGMFGNPTGGDTIQPPDPNRKFKLSKADIVAPNLHAQALYIDYWIIGDASREFPGDSWEAHTASQVCNEIVNTFVPGSQESILECRKIAARYVGSNVDSAKVYDSVAEPIVFGTGHCHIDTCWLWPFDETKRKVARSWASQCNLLDRYPEHRFTASSAQQYKWLEIYYPKLFDRVRDHVKNGTFQYIGGSWVEHDTNLPSGESLVRQFILGQRYFQSRFGVRCNTFWLPDTFGYSAQLPQLCRLSGMTRFMTQKLSWYRLFRQVCNWTLGLIEKRNNINKFPHTTFNWIALDGSQVLCHMPPSETYTAQAHFGDVKRSVTQHKSMDQDTTSLLVFGYGDGGGGPTAEHLEKLRRCRGVSDTVGLLPRVKMGDSVDDFFSRLEKKEASGKQKLVTWYGELYFELHRGTYTTQSNNKKNNRQAEVALKNVEFLAAYASLCEHSKGYTKKYKYPKKDIDELWEIICLCQFHDCLPGSSIEMCYRDSDKLYAELFERSSTLIEEASAALGITYVPGPDTEPFAVNTLPWDRTELVKLPGHVIGDSQAAPGGNKYAFLGTKGVVKVAEDGPRANGKRHAYLRRSRLTELVAFDVVSETEKDVFVLSNDKLMAVVQGGRVTSLVDLQLGRELIPQGANANQLVIMDDKPLYWQAWDVEVYHLETRKELPPGKVSILEEGPLKVSLLVETKISETSWIKTTISLQAAVDGAGNYLEFDNEIEWREDMKFLKVEFPVDVHNTEASYETQYGIVRRPTHYNTSWDMAKFEVCCHKWADLSEYGYGVSILNDCKYGFATVGNVMRLSLIRAPKAPDAHADMGRHTFRYAILPHQGSLSEVTVRTATAFNNPLRCGYVARGAATESRTLMDTLEIRDGSPGVLMDTVKRGEDDEDVSTGGLPTRKAGRRSLICRIYDSLGGRANAVVHTRLPVQKVFKTNLLEDDLEEINTTETGDGDGDGTRGFKISLRPFEVATYRLEL